MAEGEQHFVVCWIGRLLLVEPGSVAIIIIQFMLSVEQVNLGVGGAPGVFGNAVVDPGVAEVIALRHVDDATLPVVTWRGLVGSVGKEADIVPIVVGPVFHGRIGPCVVSPRYLLVVHEVRRNGGVLIGQTAGIAAKYSEALCLQYVSVNHTCGSGGWVRKGM